LAEDGLSPDALEREKRRGTDAVVKLGARVYQRLEITGMALVLLQRYCARASVRKHDMVDVAAACLLLAAKLDESSKRPFSELVSELLKLTSGQASAAAGTGAQMAQPSLAAPDPEAAFACSERVIVAERSLLHVIEYDCEVATPYPWLQPACRSLELSAQLERASLKLINQMLCTWLPLLHDASALAHTAVWMCATDARVLPEATPGFFSVLSTPMAEMEAVKASYREALRLFATAVCSPGPEYVATAAAVSRAAAASV